MKTATPEGPFEVPVSTPEDRTHWPLETKEKAKDMIVRLGWTVKATASALKIPLATCECWNEKGDWVALRRRLAEKRHQKLVAEIESPVRVASAPEIEPVKVDTQTRIDRILRQIDDIDGQLEDVDLSPRQRVELINAKSTLWGLVHPKTGTVKPSNKRSRTGAAAISPLD